jgi:hypothetical protein
MKEKIGYWVFRACVFGIGVYCYMMYTWENNVRGNQIPKAYEVVEKHCGRRGSYVMVRNNGRLYEIELYGRRCTDLVVGGSLLLLYDEVHDVFFLPGQDSIYGLGIIACLVLFLIAFLPIATLRTRMGLEP